MSVHCVRRASGLEVTIVQYTIAIRRILLEAPNLLTLEASPGAAAQNLQGGCLEVFGADHVPVEVKACSACGGELYRRHRRAEAKFLTLARGLVHGTVCGVIGVGIRSATQYMRAYGGGTMLRKSLSFLMVFIVQYMQCRRLHRKQAVGFLQPTVCD